MKALLAFLGIFFGIQIIFYSIPPVIIGWIGFGVSIFVIYLLGKAFRA